MRRLGLTLLLGLACIAIGGCSQVTLGGHAMQNQSPPQARALAEFHQQMEARIAAVQPAPEKAGGRVKVVLPDRDRLRPLARQAFTGGAPSSTATNVAMDAYEALLDANVEGLRRSGLFDSVTVIRQNDTLSPAIESYDYLIYYQVKTNGPNFTGGWTAHWLMRRAGDSSEERIATDPGVASTQSVNSWVKSVQLAALRLGALSNASTADAEVLRRSAATGFAVSPTGHLLTNYHAVENCAEVRVAGGDGKWEFAVIVARDPQNDLALLKLERRFEAIASFRDGSIRQGDAVLAVGYPLADLLGSNVSVTTGTVSALSGVRDDTRYLQFTAPVQQGNSGGPLLDDSGHVAGLVTAKLSALTVAAATGDVPQNVNFAVKAPIVELFLETNNVLYRSAGSAKQRSAAEIADRARRYTLQVECYR